MELSHSSVATALSDSATSDGGAAAAADEALRRLSEHFETLLLSPDHAEAFLIINKGDSELEIPVHRCVLAARSPFFKRYFSTTPKEQRIKMKDLVSGFDVGFDSLRAVLGYLYSGRVGLLPMEACACADEDCLHLWCRPVVDFALGVLCTSLKFEIPELVSMYQRRLIEILEHVEIDDVLLIFSVIIKCNDSPKRLFTKCIKTVASSNLDVVTLEKALPQDHVKKVMDLRRHDLCVEDLVLRVRLARILFPLEVEHATTNAKKGGTLEFFESRNLSETQLQLSRKEALSRIVELGRNCFPLCSAVVDKYLDDGTELDDFEHDTRDGRRKRFYEIYDEFLQALYQDASAWEPS